MSVMIDLCYLSFHIAIAAMSRVETITQRGSNRIDVVLHSNVSYIRITLHVYLLDFSLALLHDDDDDHRQTYRAASPRLTGNLIPSAG